MFLANSLKEKLKRNFIENEPEESSEVKFKYMPSQKDPRILLSFKDGNSIFDDTTFTTQQLQSLDKKEWENTFTLDKLKQKWKTKVNLNFEDKFKKFSDDSALPGVLKSKEYIQNLIDPDILEMKQKNWNISVNAKEKIRPELKKTIFEVSNGLNDFQVVPIKERKIEEGVDSRNFLDIDGKTWNISNKVENRELKKKDNIFLKKSLENSIKYWKDNEDLRNNEAEFPISEEQKRIEIIRYFKKYRTPFQKTCDKINLMKKVKEMTVLEREKAEKKMKYKYPGCEKYTEKINALIEKEMYNTYKNKYNELIGKIDKKELKKKQTEENKFKWKDEDLVNKIMAINKMAESGYLTNKNMHTYNTRSFSQDKLLRNFLKPLVNKGNDILMEENTIKEKNDNEQKLQKKREMLISRNRSTLQLFSNLPKLEKFESKYPLTKEQYNNLKNIEQEKNNNEELNNETTLQNFSTTKNHTFQKNKSAAYLSELSTKTGCDPYFLEAYTKVAEDEAEKLKNIYKKNRECFTYVYIHPGTYREFTFPEKIDVGRDNDIGDGRRVLKKETKYYWSCCMNSDKNSKGCQKKTVKNFQWSYFPW